MPTTLRVGTFNVENLFARFRFKGKRERYQKPDGTWGYRYRPFTDAESLEAVRDGWIVNQTQFTIRNEENKQITAEAIKAINSDVLALQEVENLDVLKRFNAQYLQGMDYDFKLVVDGNDPRMIDVGILSRYPLAEIRTHQFLRTPSGRSYVFSRDCLEVTVEIPGAIRLPLFINHFKSMIGGRGATMARRKQQSNAVKKILQNRFGQNPGAQRFVVLGDLNDYMPSSGLEPLLGVSWLENVVQTRVADPGERWTHHYSDKNEYRQLDYILLSKALAVGNAAAAPLVERRGLPKRATKAGTDRFAGVGVDRPKASDHCPVAIDLEF